MHIRVQHLVNGETMAPGVRAYLFGSSLDADVIRTKRIALL
jgi:hypothetical protein